ncbi:actin-binding Rho-activating protein-like [Pseudophryne corroboree]|uniref:actin-binding Rho-activating protein-like n=1 Tax=Pseudophryne corroboree TaxID=495146 RepID=UPI003081EE7B
MSESSLSRDKSIKMSENKSDNREQLSEAEDRKKALLSKIKILTISDLRKEWQLRSEEHAEKQRLNPFSDDFDHQHAMEVRLRKGDHGYGRPEEGSKTEERGKRALQHIHKEIEEMCLIIRDMGVRSKDGKIRVKFGRLFERYVQISDKVVGILMRARKHGRLDFEGEMLWQGVHDNVIITLLQ